MVEITQEEKSELEELVETLSTIRGRHTELVTVLIPSGQNINLVSKQLEGEKSTAANIKSKATRTNVIDAIDMIIRKLKEYQKTPENGLALFAGNVSQKEGQTDVQIWAYEPPKPLNVRTYRCDQVFVTTPLQEMLEVSEVYGLIAIDRQEATLGLLEGKQIKVLRKLTSGVPGKTRAGGQSSQRFERITEGLAKDFFRRVSEAAKEEFFHLDRLKGILLGGPIPTKEEFLDESQLATKLKEKVISIKDIGYVDEHGLELLVEASQEDIAQQELIKEKKILEKFFETLGKKSSHALYGIEKVSLALERGAVETLLITKTFVKSQIDKTKSFESKAKSIGSEVVIISDKENQDAVQFENLTKGVGAILRFQIE
jgi:peptide chain release factor subunit 1